MEMVIKSVTVSPLRQAIMTLCSILPFGEEIISSETGGKYFFKSAFALVDFAKRIVDLKRKQASAQKVR